MPTLCHMREGGEGTGGWDGGCISAVCLGGALPFLGIQGGLSGSPEMGFWPNIGRFLCFQPRSYQKTDETSNVIS